MILNLVNKRKKQEIIQFLEKIYGIKLPSCQMIQQAKDRLRIFTGNLSEHELAILDKTIRIESIGLYFAFYKDQDNKKEFRISFDSSFLVKEATKNFIELNEEQFKKWMAGEDLEPTRDQIEKNNLNSSFILLRYKKDIVGCGKLTQGKILNFVPKERRIKSR